MRVAHHLVRNPSGLFYFRMRVPADLWTAIGARLVKRALRTRCPRTAQAIALVLADRYARAFKALRQGGAMKTKPPSIEDILSGRSGDGGDIRTWTTDEMEVGPRGVRFKGLNITDDADQARFNSFLDRVAINLPGGAVPLAELGPKPEPEKTEANGFIAFDAAKEKWAQTLPDKTPPKQKTKRAKLKALEDVEAVFAAFPASTRPRWVRDITSLHCSELEIELLKKLDRRTVENKFIVLGQFLKWARKSGYLPKREGEEGLPSDGFGRVPKKDKAAANAANGAQKFRPDQLVAIFDPAHYGDLPQEADRWLPLVCLYTGARGNEIARLELADIYEDEFGVPVFDISLVGDDKSIKVSASARHTPVHPDLVALGLLERVERLKAEGEVKLFPALTFNAQNGPANAPMTAFTRYLAARGVKARGTGTVGVHSFRDTVLNKLKVGGVVREVREEYTGHAITSKPEYASAYEDPFSTVSLAKTCHPVLAFGLNIDELRKLLC